MTWQSWTALLLVILLVLVIVYDAVTYALGGNQATISQVCLSIANEYRGFSTIVGFVVGVLFGHLFLPQHVAAPVPLKQVQSESEQLFVAPPK